MPATREVEWYSKIKERTEDEIAKSLVGMLRAENQKQCHPSDAKSKFQIKITVEISSSTVGN